MSLFLSKSSLNICLKNHTHVIKQINKAHSMSVLNLQFLNVF